MNDIVYKAVHHDTSISHGKFKYIDKWRSKSGKWVYKYKKDLDQTVTDARKKLSERDRRFVIRPNSKKKSSKGSEWHDTGSDAMLSKKQKYNASMEGYNRTRVRKVKDSSGKTTYRREYQDSASNSNLNRRLDITNDYKKARAGVFKKIMDLNDKYGPKYVSETHGRTSDGQHYVIELSQNLIGGRTTSAETYTYYDTKRIERDKDRRRPSKKKYRKTSKNAK